MYDGVAAVFAGFEPGRTAWAKLKGMIDRINLNLDKLGCAAAERFGYSSGLIEQAWVELGHDYFDLLISTMDHRIEAVITQRRWYAKHKNP